MPSLRLRFRAAVLALPLLALAAASARPLAAQGGPLLEREPGAAWVPRPGGIVAAFARARDAARAGDAAGLRDALRAADSLAPGHPAVLWQLARAEAAAGDAIATLGVLRRLAPLGLAADVRADTLFAPLRGHPAFLRAADALAANAAPVVRSDTSLVVPDPDLLPESVAHDPEDGSFYLGSLYRNVIVRVAPDGAVEDFARLGGEGRGRVVGIKADPARGLLWACVVQYDPAAPATFAGPGGWTSLVAFDLGTGDLVRWYTPGDARSPHLFNDLEVTPRGDVYVTDQWGDAVLRLSARGDTLEPVIAARPGFHWPNGIALSPDGRRLYVAHAEGISAWDLRERRLVPLAHPLTAPLAETDGLYACRGGLVAVQRAAGFEQVVRLPLSPDGLSVTGAEVLERRHPAHDRPTTGVIVGDALFYVANSQYTRVSSDGRLSPSSKPSAGAVVLRLPLGGECR